MKKGKSMYTEMYKYDYKNGIIRLIDLINNIENLSDKCYTILKIDVHGICFSYL